MKRFIPTTLSILLLTACSNEPKNEHPKPPEMYQAYIVAQVLIKSNLKDPDGAEFIDGNRKEDQYPDSSYVFRGYVKATNGLGLKAPIEYNVGLKWKGGQWDSDSSWTIKFSHLGNPDL